MTISQHTPPGTHIVCVNDADTSGALVKGQVYVLAEVLELEILFGLAPSIYVVTVQGVMCRKCGDHLSIFDRQRFDLAVLPKAITELLTKQPVDA